MRPGEPSPTEPVSQREIVIARVFDAPPELLWKAWTDPQEIVRWWGPRGFTTTIHEMDVRPGGAWIHTMHGPDGTDYPTQGTFTEVVEPARIVYTMVGGRRGGPRHQFESTWLFERVDHRTRLTLRMVFPSARIRREAAETYGVLEGGLETLDRLVTHIATKQKERP